MKIKYILQPFSLILAMLTILSLFSGALMTAAAVPDAVGVVIDDFEDGDSSDWGFFSGNLAGGGGGVLDDRPYEGSFYLSTGWGGQGSASGFYGGAFKNFEDATQVTPPNDPWFNVWVLNQSDATVDSYTLEITIREDLDGNGWTSGAEDSFRLDTTFPASSFNDQWMLVSAPLSGFTDLFTGGDGTFNGDLDEVVIVISGVAGADPSTVEVDFDQFAFSSSGPLAFEGDVSVAGCVNGQVRPDHTQERVGGIRRDPRPGSRANSEIQVGSAVTHAVRRAAVDDHRRVLAVDADPCIRILVRIDRLE